MADERLRRARAAYANRQAEETKYDDMSFGAAFNAAKREGRSDFPWKGQTYSTKTAAEQGREIAAKAAKGSGRGTSAGRTAADRDTAPPPTLRSLLGTTAPEVKEDALTRIAGRQPTKRPEQERDEARDRAMAALSLMGGLGTNVGLRALAGRMRAGQPAPASRGPLVRDDDVIPAFKKGGSVKGAGIAKRGVRKCKVY